jgi:hypothetical protein
MSRSPLSGAFAGSSEPAKKNKKNGALLLISGIALATSIGGVFAANSITFNGNPTATIEFGQGVVATSSCDTGLDASITQEYDNALLGFKVDEVLIEGIAAECSGVTFNVTLLDELGSTLNTFDFLSGAGTTHTEDLSTANIDAGLVNRVTVTTE